MNLLFLLYNNEISDEICIHFSAENCQKLPMATAKACRNALSAMTEFILPYINLLGVTLHVWDYIAICWLIRNDTPFVRIYCHLLTYKEWHLMCETILPYIDLLGVAPHVWEYIAIYWLIRSDTPCVRLYCYILTYKEWHPMCETILPYIDLLGVTPHVWDYCSVM